MARRPTSHRVRAHRHLPARDACPPGSGRAPTRATGAPPRTRSDARPATGRNPRRGTADDNYRPGGCAATRAPTGCCSGRRAGCAAPRCARRRHPGFVPRAGDPPSRCAHRLAPLPAGRCARWNNPGPSGARGRSCAIAGLKRSDYRVPPIPMRFPAPRPDRSSSLAVAPRDGGIAPDPRRTQSLRRTSRQPGWASKDHPPFPDGLAGLCKDESPELDESEMG